MEITINSSGWIKDLIGGEFEHKLEYSNSKSIYEIFELLNLDKNEVGLVILNGKSLTFDYNPKDKDVLILIPPLVAG